MALNSAMEKKGRIPTEVKVTRNVPQTSRKPVTLRSEHRVQSVLLASDQAKLDEADRHLATFSLVPLSAYQRRGIDATTAQQPATAR
jgi:hypothetical protein